MEVGDLEASEDEMGKSPTDLAARALHWAAEAPVSVPEKRAALEAVCCLAKAKKPERNHKRRNR